MKKKNYATPQSAVTPLNIEQPLLADSAGITIGDHDDSSLHDDEELPPEEALIRGGSREYWRTNWD